jgi:hypothetical protein
MAARVREGAEDRVGSAHEEDPFVAHPDRALIAGTRHVVAPSDAHPRAFEEVRAFPREYVG